MFLRFCRKCRETLQLLEISRFQFNFHHDYNGDIFNFRLNFRFDFHRATRGRERGPWRCRASSAARPEISCGARGGSARARWTPRGSAPPVCVSLHTAPCFGTGYVNLWSAPRTPACAPKLSTVRSRWYWHQSQRWNTRWKALDEIYKLHIFSCILRTQNLAIFR